MDLLLAFVKVTTSDYKLAGVKVVQMAVMMVEMMVVQQAGLKARIDKKSLVKIRSRKMK